MAYSLVELVALAKVPAQKTGEAMNESPLERPRAALAVYLRNPGLSDRGIRIVVESLLDDENLVNVIAGADIIWHSGGVQMPLDAYIVSHLRRYWLGEEQ